MIAPKLISDFVPALSVDDTGEYALMQMHEYNVNNLAVTDGAKDAGLVSMEDVMKAAVDFNVKVVPVIDEDENYLGLISAESCMRAFATLNSVSDKGGIIELERSVTDYSLSEVARIVEENEAQILSFYTQRNHEEGTIQITIKLNTTELNGIISAFERYEYQVLGVFNETEYTEDMKERYDALMRYLNV